MSTWGKETTDDDELLSGYIREQSKKRKTEVDPDRERYVEEQLKRRLGRSQPGETPEEQAEQREDDVYAIPLALRAQKTTQEDVSAWMTGIVEVPLTVTNKLRNIEETEAAKKRLMPDSETRSPGLEGPGMKQDALPRVSFPMRFGKQTAKEEDWRQRAIQKSMHPRDRKKKRHPL